jgi:hypothetical protein
VLAGLDTSVLEDVRLLGLEDLLAEVLDGRGWTTAFVDREFRDPIGTGYLGVGHGFPFIEVDPVDARLMPRINRDQVAIAGRRGAATGESAGRVSVVHVARFARPGSVVLSNDPCTAALGRRRKVSVRGTFYIVHCSCHSGLLGFAEARDKYDRLLGTGRRLPRLTRTQLDEYLKTGNDPR